MHACVGACTCARARCRTFTKKTNFIRFHHGGLYEENDETLSHISCTGLRGGKYADVSNAAALRDLSKMYITYVPGLQDGTEVPKLLTRDV